MKPLDSGMLSEVRQITGDKIVLSFSCGKESLCCWLALRDQFDILPVYMYLIPGLEFVEHSLRYYENWFGRRIIRMPHPSLYRMLNNAVFQAPQNLPVLDRLDLPSFAYEDVIRVVKEDHRLPPGSMNAVGVRAADSPIRRIAITKYGVVNRKAGKFFPIHDWLKADLLDCLRGSGIRLPVDYQLFGRSFDGIDYRFLRPIRDHFPGDYRRILEFFPLADLEIFRRLGRV